MRLVASSRDRLQEPANTARGMARSAEYEALGKFPPPMSVSFGQLLAGAASGRDFGRGNSLEYALLGASFKCCSPTVESFRGGPVVNDDWPMSAGHRLRRSTRTPSFCCLQPAEQRS